MRVYPKRDDPVDLDYFRQPVSVKGYFWKGSVLMPIGEEYHYFEPLNDIQNYNSNRYLLFETFSLLELEKDAILEFANKYGNLGFRKKWKQSMDNEEGEWVEPKNPGMRGAHLNDWVWEICQLRSLYPLWQFVKEQEKAPKKVIEEVEDSFRFTGEKLVFLGLGYKKYERQKIKEQAKQATTDNYVFRKTSTGPVLAPVQGGEPDLKPLFEEVVASTTKNPDYFERWKKTPNWVDVARLTVATRVSSRLKGRCAPRLVPTKDGLKPLIVPDDFVTCLWYQLFKSLSGETRIRRCLICGRWINVTGCKPSKIQHSNCGNMKRVKKSREKQSEKGKK